MLHEILLSLSGWSTGILQFAESDNPELEKVLHPGERLLIKEISAIADELNVIRKFVKQHKLIHNKAGNANDAEYLRPGLYLRALCNGMDQALEPFNQNIVDLEQIILNDAHTPLSLILCHVQKYIPLISVLNSIIREIITQKTHGCKLLQCLHRYMHTGVLDVKVALEKMVHCCHIIFYKQLTSWLLYGHLEDSYKEFFIQKIPDVKNNLALVNDKDSSGITEEQNSGKSLTDMWDYDIQVDMLPSYIRPSLAGKVLTIGQTIIMFGNDPRQKKDFNVFTKAENSIWGEKEYEYFHKLQNLQTRPTFSIIEFERTVDELKRCVTEHLWRVAVEEAQLMQQLKLIKDFYLFGRGDLFLEFIGLTADILKKIPTSHTSRDVNLAFQMTLRKMHLNDESAVESFSFLVPVPETETEKNDDEIKDSAGISEKERQDPIEKRGWGLIILQYKVVWPLHLLFSPTALKDYNTVFRFLLRVKKTQINLRNLWSEHMRAKNVEIGVTQLRNNLIFAVDNLQYYLQVDVLESQYTIMENSMKNTRNFEDVQSAHSIFLANIMSQTFLSGSTTGRGNPVNKLIRLLLRLCDDFILQTSMWEVDNLLPTEKEELKNLSEALDGLMDWLTKTLNKVRAQPCGEHLAQLLLRLDFNRWFSRKV
ncbi:gamma-tubulin complex component 4 [Cephus cinctus]|uniref:Gamma-tubulin complex component n=1 Tax=Cephus cinctus TaxID=211228 RepID=A0AAJ7R7V9_CEPCN|nr:gamma-tubulin complex component 4 [Cephus cinctus]XP_024935967.1 gamma-tubulin complex component 4 [Cephus cinctus]